MEEQRLADGFAVESGDQDFGVWFGAEECRPQLFFRRFDDVREFFVFGEFADQPENQRNVGLGGRLDVDGVTRHGCATVFKRYSDEMLF